jgi:TATA-binding protein-associated factor Taf7
MLNKINKNVLLRVGVQIYRDAEQPDPLFKGAVNERMVFQIYGRKYPASLIDLPCPVETHRTFDRVALYKSSDVGQILIVYGDELSRKHAEDEARPRRDDDLFTGHKSGLCPPTTNITKTRYAETRSKLAQFPKSEIEAAEAELVKFFEAIGRTSSSQTAAESSYDLPPGSVIISDEEDVVDFAEYMWSRSQPQGIRVDEGDRVAKEHPEIFLKAPKQEPRKPEEGKPKKERREKPPKERKEAPAKDHHIIVEPVVTEEDMAALKTEDLEAEVAPPPSPPPASPIAALTTA